jgi:hypothetical protein
MFQKPYKVIVLYETKKRSKLDIFFLKTNAFFDFFSNKSKFNKKATKTGLL